MDKVMSFIAVYESEESEPVELPVEEDDSILFSTLAGQFPKVCGLKYRPSSSGTYRAVKLCDGKLFKPSEGWCNKFICVFPKEVDNKRKCDEESDYCTAKTKRLEGKKCTDLIVLNLGWKVDEDLLRKYFSKFGDLVLVQIKRERETNQSKGYAFIRFADYDSQVLCLAEKHVIDGRLCAVKVPFSKTEADKQEISKKIHVSYTSEEVTPDDMRKAFEEYGNVTDIFIPKPFRNFAFITFDNSDAVQSLIGQSITIKGHLLNIGSAVPKITSNRKIPTSNNNNSNNNNLMYPESHISNQSYPAAARFNMAGYDGVCAAQQHKSSRQNRQQTTTCYGGFSGLLPTPNPSYVLQNGRSAMEMMAAANYGAQHTDMGQNTAAMAALNILNNPDVVAAIVAAAANKSGNPQNKFTSHQTNNL